MLLHFKQHTAYVAKVTNALQLVLLVIGLATLPACTNLAPNHTPAVWVGSTFAELHKAFGDPAAVLINSDNNRVYAFRDTIDPSADKTTQLTYGEGELIVKNADCVVLFELAEKTVTSWDWQGEGCGNRRLPLPYQVRHEGLDRRTEVDPD